MIDEQMTDDDARVYAWSDYRKAYGVSASALVAARKAFKAGWEAANGTSFEGPLR